MLLRVIAAGAGAGRRAARLRVGDARLDRADRYFDDAIGRERDRHREWEAIDCATHCAVQVRRNADVTINLEKPGHPTEVVPLTKEIAATERQHGPAVKNDCMSRARR
jgi:hypothetical protein